MAQPKITEIERQFLIHLCQDKPMEDIAKAIYRSKACVDNIRDRLVEKIGCRTRIGLVVFAIRTGIYLIID